MSIPVVCHRTFVSADELNAMAQEEWEAMPQHMCFDRDEVGQEAKVTEVCMYRNEKWLWPTFSYHHAKFRISGMTIERRWHGVQTLMTPHCIWLA